MRILYLMTEPFGIGGVQSDLLILSQDLTARGHEVHVATTRGELLDELKGRGARHVDIDFNYRGLPGLWRAAAALRRAVMQLEPDLVAPQSVRSSIVAWLALRATGRLGRRTGARGRVPIVTTVHNIHNPAHFSYAGYILRLCADHVIFESHYERNRLLASGLPAGRSEVIHSGIDTRKFKPQSCDQALAAGYGLRPGEHRIFGCIARLSEEKGHRYLLEAFAQVHRGDSRARLLLVGDGPLRAAIEQQIRDLQLQSVVTLAGTRRDVAAHLSIIEVFVLASTRESFPLAAREAMAAGRAVIAPRIGGCPEVVDEGRTGLLFSAADVPQLAECMSLSLAGDNARAWGAAGCERVQRLFSRDSWVAGDETVYRRFASRESPRAMTPT